MPTLLSFKEAISYKPYQRLNHGSSWFSRKKLFFNNEVLLGS